LTFDVLVLDLLVDARDEIVYRVSGLRHDVRAVQRLKRTTTALMSARRPATATAADVAVDVVVIELMRR